MKRKVIAILLAVFMVVGYMPTMMGTVLAAEEDGGETKQVAFVNDNGPFSFAGLINEYNPENQWQSSDFRISVPVGYEIGSVLGEEVEDPVHAQGYEFIGWVEAELGEVTDESGEVYIDWVVKDSNAEPITTADMLAREITAEDSDPVCYKAVWVVEDDGNGDPGEGPVWPGVNSVIHVNGEVAREVWVQADSEPLQFQCDEDDTVTLHVDLSEDSIFEDAQVSWEKWAEDSNENLGSGDTCTISVTADDIDCNLYVCKIRTVNDEQWTYKFAPRTEVEDDGPAFEIPENMIIVEYWFATRSGQYNFFPVSVVLDGYAPETTLQDLVDEYGEGISGLHYKDENLIFDHWEITSGEGDVEIGNCGGGFSLNAGARYADDAVAVQTYLNYYDVDGKQCSEEKVVVVKDAKTKNIDDVYAMLEDDGTLDAIEHYSAYDFTGDWELFSWNYELLNKNEDGTYEYYIEPVDITAVYSKQPVEITCTYNEDGKAVTVSGEALLDKAAENANIYTVFEAWLTENSIPTDGVTGWAFSGAEAMEPAEQGNAMMVAAVYEDATPVYIGRDFVKCDSVDGQYYFGSAWNEIIYVNSAFSGDVDDEDFCDALKTAVDAEYGEDPNEDEGMRFEGYDVVGGTYNDETVKQTTAYLYNYAPEYKLNAVYNKVYVEIVGADGSVKQVLVDPNNPEENPFIIGTANNGELWNEEGAGFGGTAIPGGSEVYVQAPYMRYSLWTLGMYELEEVPEGLDFDSVEQLQDAMDEETLDAISWDGDAFKANYYEVSLFINTEDGQTPVSNEDFPENGICVVFEYPEGTDKDTDFVVTHMFTEAATIDGVNYSAGDIETIKEGDRLIKTDRGIKVLMYSLSPIGVAYGDAIEDDGNQGDSDDPTGGNEGQQPGGNGNQPIGGNGTDAGDAAAGGDAAADNADNATKTGDDFNMALPIALVGLAVISMAAAVFVRRKFN